jgi:hypothetical protein
MKRTITTLVILSAVSMLYYSCGKDSAAPESQVTAHTYSVSTWYWDAPHHYVDLQIDELTAANVQSAGVMVYYSVTPGTWISVPYTVYGTLHDYHMGFSYAQNVVEVTWLYDGPNSGSDPNAYYSTTVKCKVVVVPSSVRQANPDVDWNNYDQVKRTFHLKD